MYRWLRALLFLMPPETAHNVTTGLWRLLLKLPGLAWLVRQVLGCAPKALAVDAMGLHFTSPVGIAAGFDKNARAVNDLGVLGFGAVEIGTVTAHAQPGQVKPRLFRLPRDQALLNRMGFNNDGCAAVSQTLTETKRLDGLILGINVGKSKITPNDSAAKDYEASVRALAPQADYLVINVSSPNTPGLRDLQAVEHLEPLVAHVQQTLNQLVIEGAMPRQPPLLVKVAPDLANEDVDAIADMALRRQLSGIIATNTTLSREGLRTPSAVVTQLGAGGISGQPVKARSLAVLRRLAARVDNKLTLISVGGIRTADDVWERLMAGADLVQLYTGFIYEGPGVAHSIHKGLLRKLKQSGHASLAEAKRHAASTI